MTSDSSSSPEIPNGITSRDTAEGNQMDNVAMETKFFASSKSAPEPAPSQEPLTTIVQLDTSPEPDDEDSTNSDDASVSPLSDRAVGTRWTRFFPELSSHFSLVSPVAKVMRQPSFPELGDLDDFAGDNLLVPAGEKARSSSSCSDDRPDNASSCYSNRTSVTSMGSEHSVYDRATALSSHDQSSDTYSIVSPITAGVFDDITPVHPSPTDLLGKNLSMDEVMNKPLPLEPPMKMAPLNLHRHLSLPCQTCGNVLPVSNEQLELARHLQWEQQFYRYCPTLSQAAEELEDMLSSFRRSTLIPEKAARILEQPMQTKRSLGTMIATRPAPRPPSTEPHITTPPRKPSSLSLTKAFERRHSDKAPQAEDTKPKKVGKHKLQPSFSVPTFGRKRGSHRHHRSVSNSNLKLRLGDLPSSSDPFVPGCINRNRAVLPSQLPRLQTAELESPTPPVRKSPFSPFRRTWREKNEKPRDSSGLSSPKQEDPLQEKVFLCSTEDRRPSSCDLVYRQSMMQVPDKVYELDASCSSPKPKPKPKPQNPSSSASAADLPDDIIYSIMEQIDTLNDLFDTAVVNKTFYRVFKQNELHLIKNTLFKMSPPAWELREMSPPWAAEWQILLDPDAPVPEYTPTVYLRRHAQDIYTLAQLKSLILTRCASFLRHDTIRGLAGIDNTRAAEVDDAFWRIWTFCRVFGSGKDRENDILGQMDWLNGGRVATLQQHSSSASISGPFAMDNVLFEPPAGFARGNRGGLSLGQLYDMTEIWTCLGVLLQPLHGKCIEARQVGIYEGHDVAVGETVKEETVLEEWTSYVLTLGPSAVLCLSSICRIDKPKAIFEIAKDIGLTQWRLAETNTSRSPFLKEAVSRAFESRGRQSPIREKLPGVAGPQITKRISRPGESTLDRRQRQAAFAAELRSQQIRPRKHVDCSFESERPLSNFHAVLDRLEGIPHDEVPPLPASTFTLPTRRGSSNSRDDQIPRAAAPRPNPQVLDPVDRAIRMMVEDLGFSEEDAKWALKITDTGEGIDVNSAVSLLLRERKKQERQRRSHQTNSGDLLTPGVKSRQFQKSGWQWA